MGETLPQVKIAKRYIERGGKGIFFSHGGKFEHLAEEIGCEVIRLKDLAWKDAMVGVDRSKTTMEKQQFIVYNKKTIGKFVKGEVEAFKEKGIDLVLSSFNPTCSISARVLRIPLVALTSGATSSIYFRSGFATYPDNYENFFTRILPSSFKNYVIRWALLNNNFLVREFNKVGKKYKIKSFRTLNDILEGDHTLLCDDINFLGVKPTNKFPVENFIGPVSVSISDEKENELENDIKKHLERPGRSILFIIGSASSDIDSPISKIFLNILEKLNQTDFNVIVVCGKIPLEKLPKTNDNILIKQLIKSPQIVNKMVDLAIIHGGRGTVYNAAYSGKPSIGIPFFIEQQYNIDCLVRNKVGLKISGKYFNPEKLLKAINTIFENYDIYLKNATEFSKKLSGITGEEKAVERIIEIVDKEVMK